MKANTTKHAEKRKRQRGFSSYSIDIIEEFGRCETAPGNAVKIFFGRKEYQKAVSEFKRMIQILDKARNGTIIISENAVLTLYKQN